MANTQTLGNSNVEEGIYTTKCWMDAMHMKLNPNKTEYILFSSWQQLKKTSPEPLDAQGDPIAVSEAVSYLGGFLDQHLNFKEHIKENAKKSNGQHNKNLNIM